MDKQLPWFPLSLWTDGAFSGYRKTLAKETANENENCTELIALQGKHPPFYSYLQSIQMHGMQSVDVNPCCVKQ